MTHYDLDPRQADRIHSYAVGESRAYRRKQEHMEGFRMSPTGKETRDFYRNEADFWEDVAIALVTPIRGCAGGTAEPTKGEAEDRYWGAPLLTDAEARYLACQWHDSTEGISVEFSSTGAITNKLDLLMYFSNILDQTEDQQSIDAKELRALRRYIRRYGPREPVEGWGDLPWVEGPGIEHGLSTDPDASIMGDMPVPD